MNKDQVIDYLAGLSDRDIAALIAAAGDRRPAPEQPTASELQDALEEIRVALGQVDEQIQAAIAKGDHATSITLKRGPQFSLKQAQNKATRQLNSLLDTEGK